MGSGNQNLNHKAENDNTWCKSYIMINLDKDVGIYILYSLLYFMGPHFIWVGVQSMVRAGAPQIYSKFDKQQNYFIMSAATLKLETEHYKIDQKIENINLQMILSKYDLSLVK